jgi:prepilin-type N-terminal cleavage/methylation domain-containing protein
MMLLKRRHASRRSARGFTLPEVLVAATIMIILAVGTLSVFSYVVRLNRGENLREQSLSVMQKEIEHYRSLKFVPNSSGLTSAELDARARSQITVGGPFFSADGREFDLFVTITNKPDGASDAITNFKEITIEAKPTIPERMSGFSNLIQVLLFSA